MKNLPVILSAIIVLSSCSASRNSNSESPDRRAYSQAIVKNAVETRRYIVKLERLYSHGAMIHLKPRANFIIIDGQKAIINAAYFGRQFDIRPIAGINMRGVASDYEVVNKVEKGKYEIRMRVGNGKSSFDVFLSIRDDGTANASVNSLKIDNAFYSGYVVPISEQVSVPLQDHDVI